MYIHICGHISCTNLKNVKQYMRSVEPTSITVYIEFWQAHDTSRAWKNREDLLQTSASDWNYTRATRNTWYIVCIINVKVSTVRWQNAEALGSWDETTNVSIPPSHEQGDTGRLHAPSHSFFEGHGIQLRNGEDHIPVKSGLDGHIHGTTWKSR